MPKYRVLSRTAFMDHAPDSVFTATLDKDQERRAIERGAIEKVRRDAKEVKPEDAERG